jgi:hypothetical protein
MRGMMISDAHLAEIVLREFSRESFEADQRRDDTHPQRLHQGIDRALPARVARLARAMEQFHRPSRRLLGQRLHRHVAICVAVEGRPTCRRARSAALSIVVTSVSAGDAPLDSHGHAAQRGDLLPPVPGSPEHLNFVPLEHIDHRFPRQRWNLRRLSHSVGLPAGGQNFRKEERRRSFPA